MIGNGILFLCIFFLVYFLPGRLLYNFFPSPRQSEESFPFSIGLGLVLINVTVIVVVGIAGFYGLNFLTDGYVFAVASGVLLVLMVIWWCKGRRYSKEWFVRPSRTQILLWLLTVIAFLFYLTNNDVTNLRQDTCMVRAAMSINFRYIQPDLLALATEGGHLTSYHNAPLQHLPSDQNGFLTQNEGQRLGTGVILSPLLAIFGIFGFHIAYALPGLLLPGLGFLLGKYLFSRQWAAWATSLLLTFNPYSLKVIYIDENFFALCFSTLALALILRPAPMPALAGVALSLFLGIRHVGLLLLPFIFYFLWKKGKKDPRFKRACLRFLGGLVVFGFPYLVLHYNMFMGGNLFEGAMDRPMAPHSFLGFDFKLPVLLNFPFVSEPLRSPYNAYPTLVAFPLDLLQRFGLILAALVPAGLIHLFRQDRLKAGLLIFLFAPILLLVMVQSNWVEPNKMGIPASVLAPAILTIVAGITFFINRKNSIRSRLILCGLGFALPLLFVLLVSGYKAPEDERVYKYPLTYVQHILRPDFVSYAAETPAYVDFEQARMEPSAYPDVRLGYFHSAILRLRLSQLGDTLAHPSFREYERPFSDMLQALVMGPGRSIDPLSIVKVMESSEPRTSLYPMKLFQKDDKSSPESLRLITLDMNQCPTLSPRPLWQDKAPRGGGALLLSGGTAYLVSGFNVEWSNESESIIATRDRFGMVILIFMPALPNKIKLLNGINWVRLDARQYPDRQIPLKLPEGAPVYFLDIRSYLPTRGYARYAVVESEGVWISEATPRSF